MVDQLVEGRVTLETDGDVVGGAERQHGQRHVVSSHFAGDRGDGAIAADHHDDVGGAVEEPRDAALLVDHVHDLVAMVLDDLPQFRGTRTRARLVVVEEGDLHGVCLVMADSAMQEAGPERRHPAGRSGVPPGPHVQSRCSGSPLTTRGCSLTAAFLALLAIAVVLLPAFAGVGRPRTYAWVAFLGLIAGGVMLVATPTPIGFDPNGASHRWLLSAASGQNLSATLLAAGVAGLLGAFAVGHAEPPEVTDSNDDDD